MKNNDLTYHTAKAVHVPLCSECLDHGIRHWLAALLALRAVAVSVAVDTPSITILLYERCAGVEGVTALRTEKVSSVPLRTTRHNHLSFNRCLARLAARRKHLMEVKMAEEALRLVRTIFMFQASHVLWIGVRGEEGNVLATLACADTSDTLCKLVLWLWVEGDTFEMFSALVARETLRVEA